MNKKRPLCSIVALLLLIVPFITGTPRVQAAPELLYRKLSADRVSVRASDLEISPNGE
jgi:hypothetical protein